MLSLILVSVIVPVYKVEFYLSECIESILKQTYQNLEIILVDDGSPDDCGSICDKYAQQDKRIKVFHKNNEGLSEARNYGIERATGDYLSFVDSDDWIEPDMFETLVSVVVVNDSDIVCCGYYREYNGYKETILKIDKIIGNIVDLQKMLIIENSK